VEGQIAAKPARIKPAHLMCGSKLWTISGFICCAYFAKVAATRVESIAPWSHDPWEIATHLIWMIFMMGLITETRCRKERLFFGLVLANFGFAFVMGLWSGASDQTVREIRLVSAIAWAVAAIVSLLLMFSKGTSASLSDKSQS
jgi:hypothetical protein